MKDTPATTAERADMTELAGQIRAWARELGFSDSGISDTQLAEHETHLLNWLRAGRHGEMHYMARHGTRRSRPGDLVPGTVRVISVRMDYWPPESRDAADVLHDDTMAYLSRYALGRDYHKLLRKRLQRLADRIESAVGPFGYRAFVDSAPVLEKALAEKAGLGWIGKHSNLLSRHAGSWCFIGELYTDLPLPVSTARIANHCGTCSACLDACPTQAIVAPYQVDARRCIAYLTIELPGAIPVDLRPLLGNRVFGCDDCQLVCPWNRFAGTTPVADFAVRHGLDAPTLVDLLRWSESEFMARSEGSVLRRLGYLRWLRNLATALGNAATSDSVIAALLEKRRHPSDLVREHVLWALQRHGVEDQPA